MAKPIRVEIGGKSYPVEDGATVKVVVEDEAVERAFSFTNQLEEVITDADGDERDSALGDYEDVNSLCAGDYEIQEEEDEDDDECCPSCGDPDCFFEECEDDDLDDFGDDEDEDEEEAEDFKPAVLTTPELVDRLRDDG